MTYLEQLHNERKERMARISARAVPDRPVECLSASVKSGPAPARDLKNLDEINLDQQKQWLDHLVRSFNAPMKQPWFSMEEASVELSIRSIQKEVCVHYQVKMTDLLSERRTRGIARRRQVSMWLCRNHTGRSLPEIGRRHGGRDHTTVLYAIKVIDGLIEVDATIAADISRLSLIIEARKSA